MRFIGISIVMLTVAAMTACSGEQNSYSDYRSLPESGWRYNDVVEFVPVHTDSLCAGRFVIGVRHDNTYPYTGLMLEVAYSTVGKERVDTVSLQLADRYGNWLGKGIGMSFQLSDTLREIVHPSATAVRVRHIMKTDTLPGVNQLGVFFVPQSDK